MKLILLFSLFLTLFSGFRSEKFEVDPRLVEWNSEAISVGYSTQFQGPDRLCIETCAYSGGYCAKKQSKQ